MSSKAKAAVKDSLRDSTPQHDDEETPSLTAEWKDFKAKFNCLEKSYQEYYEALKMFEMKKRACMDEIKAAGKHLKQIEGIVNYESCQREYGAQIKEYQGRLRGFMKYFPQPHSAILRAIIGDVNLTLWNVGDRFKYKTEYEVYKMKFTILTLLLCLFNYYHPRRWVNAVFQFSMTYFYFIITTREHILLANGSAIRTWWFIEHYLLLLINSIVLVWPKEDAFLDFRPLYLLYCFYTGSVALLQYRYQMKRMYTLRALGKSDTMDITSDTVHIRANMTWLLPFLFAGQLFQLFCAYTLWTLCNSHSRWQVPSLCASFFILGVGNLWSTISTIRHRNFRLSGSSS
eukprot:Nk52_evm1s388 gene=Nk52_evmTU1s388